MIFTKFDLFQVFKASTVLFAVIDIIGSIPLIIQIKEKAGSISELRTSIVSCAIMIGFLFIGESVLSLFGVTIESFAVAGSILLFIMAIEMILGVKLFRDESMGRTASIVPLAFPLIAGAGSMTTIVSLRAEYADINIIFAILINALFVYIVLKSIQPIERVLGIGGIAIMKKVFGIILLAIAVKLFTSNLQVMF